MDTLNASAPAAVLPLNYFEQHREPWIPVVQMVARLVIALSSCTILVYTVTLVCFFWQESAPRYTVQIIPGIPLVLHLPICVAMGSMLLGAIDSVRLRGQGWRWVIRGSIAMVILAIPTELGDCAYYFIARRYYLYGPSFSIYMLAERLMAGVGYCIFPLFLLKFNKRPEVRAVFDNPGRG